MQAIKYASLLVRITAVSGLIFLSSCALFQRDPADLIIGTWQTEIGGIPLTVEYASEFVTVTGHNPVSYAIVKNVLNVNKPGYQRQMLSFDGRNTMIQRDAVTGVEQVYRRL